MNGVVFCSQRLFCSTQEWLEGCQRVDHADSQHLGFHSAHQSSAVHVGATCTHTPSALVYQTAIKATSV